MRKVYKQLLEMMDTLQPGGRLILERGTGSDENNFFANTYCRHYDIKITLQEAHGQEEVG